MAEKLDSKAYRAIGQALNKNPEPEKTPCHRIVASTGHLCGFSSGIKNKAKLLISEGIKIKNNKIFNFKEVLYKF